MTKPDIKGVQWLEKILNQRLNEILDSMHKPELKGQVRVKISVAEPEERAEQIAKVKALSQ